jgi:hypothetical protein
VRLIAEGTHPTVRRGYIFLILMTAAYGMAMAAQQNVVTNYIEDV